MFTVVVKFSPPIGFLNFPRLQFALYQVRKPKRAKLLQRIIPEQMYNICSGSSEKPSKRAKFPERLIPTKGTFLDFRI